MKEHPAIVTAIISAALVAGRLLSISRFDVNTAATVLQVSGTGTAIAGTALTLLPFALALATVAVAVDVFVDRGLFVKGRGVGVPFGILVGADICLMTTPLLVGTSVIVVAIGIAGAILRRRRLTLDVARAVEDSALLRVQLAILCALLVVTPLVLQRPWLPAQAVGLRNGSVLVGYVLGESEGRVVVMEDRDRTVHFLDPDEISSRYICTGSESPGGAVKYAPRLTLRGSVIGELLWGDKTPRYRACPSR